MILMFSMAWADAMIWLDFSQMNFSSDFSNTSCTSQLAFERVLHERVAEMFSPFEVWVTRREPIRGDVIRARFLSISAGSNLGHANGGGDYDGDGQIDGGYWNDGGEAPLDVYTTAIGAVNLGGFPGSDVDGLNCTELGRVVANVVVSHEVGHAIALAHGSGNPLSCILMDYFGTVFTGGDRRADIVVSHAPDATFSTISGFDQPRTSEWRLYWNNSGALVGPYSVGLSNVSVAGDLVRHGDVDADGRSDLLLMDSTGAWTAVEAAGVGFGPAYTISQGVGYNAQAAYRRHLFP